MKLFVGVRLLRRKRGGVKFSSSSPTINKRKNFFGRGSQNEKKCGGTCGNILTFSCGSPSRTFLIEVDDIWERFLRGTQVKRQPSLE